jgi:pimeloyl-ACP methyl ester carboxylesterase
VNQQPRLVDTPAGRIFVERAGSGPTLVLVHGYLVSQHYFRALRRDLEARFDVVALDLPGHGESDRPPRDRFAYDLPSFAAAVASALDRIGVARAHFLGHSLGGGVALTLAARHPERVDRLVLEDAVVYPPPLPLRGRIALLPVVGEVLFKQLYARRDLAAWLRFCHRDQSLLSDEDIDFYWERLNRPGGRDAMHACLQLIATLPGNTADPGRVQAPTLILWGEEDRPVPLEHGRRLARQVPGARLEVIPACGHVPHEERPAEVLRALVSFLAEAEPGAQPAGARGGSAA